MQNKKAIQISAGVMAIALIILGVIFFNKKAAAPVIQNTNDMAVLDKSQILGNKDDLVSFSILPNTTVRGVVSYRGAVKGGYFFEANILVGVTDANQKIIRQSNAVATSDWMTAEPVEFEGNIDFNGLPRGKAYIEIHNDNASGLPENDKKILIPIFIDEQAVTVTKNKIYTIRDLMDKQNLSLYSSCGISLPDVGKTFTVTGYIYPYYVSTLQNKNTITIQNIPNINDVGIDIKFISNIDSIKNAIIKKYNPNNKEWIHVNVEGILRQEKEIPTNTGCIQSFYLETSNVIVL